MPTDHVRFCVSKYLCRDALAHPDLARRARILLDDAADVDAGDVIVVQTVEDSPDTTASVFATNGFLITRMAGFVPYR